MVSSILARSASSAVNKQPQNSAPAAIPSQRENPSPLETAAFKAGTVALTTMSTSKALNQLRHIYDQFFAPPHAGKSPLPFVGKESYFSYQEVRKAALFPLCKNSPISDALHFVVDSMHLVCEEMIKLEKKYEAEVERLASFFENACMALEEHGTDKDWKKSFAKMRGEITAILKDPQGLYADRDCFRKRVYAIAAGRGLLSGSREQRRCSQCTMVEYSDIFGDMPVIIDKTVSGWEAQCDLVEGFYQGYARLMEKHALYVSQLIGGYRLLRGELCYITAT